MHRAGSVKAKLTLALLFAASACGRPQGPPIAHDASVRDTIRVARSQGAEDQPLAAAHLRLAEDELLAAQRLAADGEYSRADAVLARAQSDADRAIELGRTQPRAATETKGAEPPPHDRAAKERLAPLADVEEAPSATVVKVSESILFRLGTAELLPTAGSTLDHVAELAASGAEVAVRAYDATATLAERRAAAVASALTAKGVQRVRARGLGGDVEHRVEITVRGAPAP